MPISEKNSQAARARKSRIHTFPKIIWNCLWRGRSQNSFWSPQEPDWLLGPWHYTILTSCQMKACRMSQEN